MKDSIRGALASTLIPVVAILACFAAIVGGGCLVGGDLGACFEPFAQALARGVKNGDILRTPLLFNGMPLFAHPVVAGAYPPQYLVTLMEPARALSLLALGHLALAAAGMGLLLQRSGRSPAAATAGAILLGLSGIAVSSMLQINLLKALAWMPWVLLLTREVLVGTRARIWTFALLAVANAMLLLSAEPFVVLPAGVGIAMILLPSRAAWRQDLRAAIRPFAALACGLVVAAVLLIPTIRLSATSVRAAGFVSEGASQWSLHPVQLLSMTVPSPFGDPRLAGFDGFAADKLTTGRSNEYFASSYLGSLAVGLALAGLLFGGRRERVAALGLLGLVLLALGLHGPTQVIVDAFELHWLRYPVKWLVPALVPLAILVSAGVDALRTRMRPAALVVAGSAAMPALAALFAAPLGRLVGSWAPDELPDRIRDILVEQAHDRILSGGTWSGALSLLCLGALLLATRRGLRFAAWIPAMALLLDLGPWARRSVVIESVDVYRRKPEVVEVLLAEPARQRVWTDAREDLKHPARQAPRTLPDIVIAHRDRLLYYGGASHGIDLAFPVDVDGLSSLRQHHLVEALASAAWRERLMLLGAAGVTHVVTMDSTLEGSLVQSVAEIDVGAAKPMRVLRNRLALPRARVVPELRRHHGSEDHAAQMSGGPVDLFARVSLVAALDWPESLAEASLPPPSEGWRGSARIVAEPPGGLDVVTEGDGGALVVSDAWMLGMRATLDGQPVELFRADHAFLGVLVPAGEHRVEIRYSPWRW